MNDVNLSAAEKAKAREVDKKLLSTEEMRQFYHSLAVTHANALARVMADPNNAEDIIARARVEIDRMRTTENSLESPVQKCQKGEIWDSRLGRCVAI